MSGCKGRVNRGTVNTRIGEYVGEQAHINRRLHQGASDQRDVVTFWTALKTAWAPLLKITSPNLLRNRSKLSIDTSKDPT